MKEQLGRNGNGSMSIQEMPDFRAAVNDYREILQTNGVPQTDIDRVTQIITNSNKTRKKGNFFINLVNGIKRQQTP